MKVDALNREEARTFIKAYHIIFDRDLNDVKIKDHLVHDTHLAGVDWLKSSDVFRDDKIPLRNIELVELVM